MITLIYMLAAVFCGAFALRALAGDRHDPVRRSFTVVGALIAVSFGGFTLYLVPGLTAFRYVHSIAGTFVPVATLWFLDRLFGDPWKPSSRLVRRMWTLSALVAIAFAITDIAFYWHIPRASIPEVVLSIYILGGFGIALHRLWTAHVQAEHRVDRARIRYLLFLLGSAVTFTALEQLVRSVGPAQDATTLTLLRRAFALQGAFPPVGAVMGTLFVYFLSQAVQLYRLLDLHEIFSRAFTLAVAALLLVVVDGVTVIWLDILPTYPVHGTFQIFLASVLFLSLYDPLRSRIESLAGEWFNRQGRRLELALGEIDHKLATVLSLEGLENELLGRLQASGRAPLVAMYLWEPSGGAFRLRMQRGPSDPPLLRAIAARPFSTLFQEGQRYLERNELQRTVTRQFPGHEGAALALRTLDAMNADLCLPILSGELVLGWVCLKSEGWSDGFTKDEIRRLLNTVARAAAVLENIFSVEKIKEQHRLAALGTMAAGLAHEIRNPLAGIKGAAQYLQGGAEPAEVPAFLDVIVGETDRLNGVLTLFLDYARPFVMHPTTCRPELLVQRVVEVVQAEGLGPNVALHVELDEALPSVEVDTGRLHQVLLNLCHNALHAVGDNGTVTIRTRKGRMSGPGRRGQPAIQLEVEDSGPGIPPEDREKLFIPFFTTKRQGTGLGLAISRRLVEAHAGEISVRTKVGSGSTFVVRIPLTVPLPNPPLPSAV